MRVTSELRTAAFVEVANGTDAPAIIDSGYAAALPQDSRSMNARSRQCDNYANALPGRRDCIRAHPDR
jgi:hypothetical protein